MHVGNMKSPRYIFMIYLLRSFDVHVDNPNTNVYSESIPINLTQSTKIDKEWFFVECFAINATLVYRYERTCHTIR